MQHNHDTATLNDIDWSFLFSILAIALPASLIITSGSPFLVGLALFLVASNSHGLWITPTDDEDSHADAAWLTRPLMVLYLWIFPQTQDVYHGNQDDALSENGRSLSKAVLDYQSKNGKSMPMTMILSLICLLASICSILLTSFPIAAYLLLAAAILIAFANVMFSALLIKAQRKKLFIPKSDFVASFSVLTWPMLAVATVIGPTWLLMPLSCFAVCFGLCCLFTHPMLRSPYNSAIDDDRKLYLDLMPMLAVLPLLVIVFPGVLPAIPIVGNMVTTTGAMLTLLPPWLVLLSACGSSILIHKTIPHPGALDLTSFHRPTSSAEQKNNNKEKNNNIRPCNSNHDQMNNRKGYHYKP